METSPQERETSDATSTESEYQYVVATDLAARGIDIEGVSCY